MVKIIFSDLDNTLADKRNISKNNINAINKYISMGKLFVITSGRSVSYINKIKKGIKGIRYIIGNNGSIIYDNKGKKVIYCNLIDYENVVKLYDLCNKVNAKFIMTGIENDYVNKNAYYNQKVLSSLDRKIVEKNYVSQIIIDTENKDGILHIIDEVEKIQGITVINKSRALYDDTYICNNYWINIGSMNVNKGISVKYLCEYLNENLNNTLRIGDDLNDLPMFFDGGINVSLENGFKEVKKRADYIVPSYKDDAICYLINNVLSEEKNKMKDVVNEK